MQTVKYQNTTLLSAKALLKKANVRFGKKTFEYLRDTLHLLPKPLKIPFPSRGGTIGFYPENVALFLSQIEEEHKKGSSYPKIASKLRKEGDKLLEQADSLRRQYETEKRVLRNISADLITTEHPETSVKPDIVIKTKTGDMITIEVKKINSLKNEIKKCFEEWDGKSTKELKAIKGSIEELERLEKLLTDRAFHNKLLNALRSSKKVS